MDKKKKDKKEKKEKISKKDKKDKKDKYKSFLDVSPVTKSSIPSEIPSYLRHRKVNLPQQTFSNSDWAQAGIILASDTVTSFETLSLNQTTLDETITGHVCNIVRGNKHFKSLELCTITIAQPEFEALCEALKVNSSVKSLKFESVGLSLGQFQALSKCMEINRNVEALHIINDKFYPISADSIRDIFTKNPIVNSLSLAQVAFQASAFDKISDMIKSAPNLTELNFVEVELDDKKATVLFDALKVNKTIKKLRLENSLKAPSLIHLGDLLDMNTVIKKFSILHKLSASDDVHERLANGLKKNYSLKSLKCTIDSQKGCETLLEVVTSKPNIKALKLDLSGVTNHSSLVNLLKENRTLQKLEYLTKEELSTEALGDIFNAIKVNRGLRKFGFNAGCAQLAPCRSFFEAIKINDTLNYLYTKYTLAFAASTPEEDSFWSKFTESLQHNEALTGVAMIRVVTLSSVEPLLTRNKAKQLAHIRRVRTVIKSMVLRAEQFSLLLPLEIWAMILSAVEFPGVTVDFGKVLIDQINAQ